jgi:hypothetical protein
MDFNALVAAEFGHAKASPGPEDARTDLVQNLEGFHHARLESKRLKANEIVVGLAT